MKKFLLPENVNWYRANMHCHTVCSDGQMTPEEVKELYMSKGYSIIAYSDHEILLDHSDLSDENFLAITSCEYSVTEADPSLPQIFDVDTGRWPRAKCYHFNIFAKDPHNTFQPATNIDQHWILKDRYKDTCKCDGMMREYSVEGANEIIRRCNEAGFLVQYNHPYWSLNEREDYIGLKGLWSLEILNYSTELETGSEYCPYIYDDMVRHGMYNLFCTMGDDNHNPGKSDKYCFGGSTIIGAKELEYGQVMDALEKGEFYCASGIDNPPAFNALYVEDNMIKIDCSPCTSVILNGYGRCDRNILGENITHAEFPLRESDVYFLVTLRDGKGNYAHTHFYKVSDYLEK